MALKDLIVRGPMPTAVKPRIGVKRGRKPKKAPPPTKTYRKRSHNLEPQIIDQETWFYEDRKGLLIVHEIRTDSGKHIRTDQFTIPWKHVMASAERHKLKVPS